MSEKKNKTPLMIAAVIAILATAVYSANAWYRFSVGIPNDRPPEWGEGGPGDQGPGGFRGGPPTEAERQERFQQMSAQLNLTPEQQSQIQQIMAQPWEGGPEGGRSRFEQMREVLTPAQQEQAQQMFRSGMQQRMQQRMERERREAKKNLPEGEYKQFEALQQERMKAMEQRMREGRGPGGGRRGGGPGSGGPGGGPGGPGGGR